jgi:hypothetical protein
MTVLEVTMLILGLSISAGKLLSDTRIRSTASFVVKLSIINIGYLENVAESD